MIFMIIPFFCQHKKDLAHLTFRGRTEGLSEKRSWAARSPFFRNGQLPLAQIGKGMNPGNIFQCIDRGHAAAVKETAFFLMYGEGEEEEEKYHPSMFFVPIPAPKNEMKREHCGRAASPLVKNDRNRRWKSMPPQEDLLGFFFQVSAYPPST